MQIQPIFRIFLFSLKSAWPSPGSYKPIRDKTNLTCLQSSQTNAAKIDCKFIFCIGIHLTKKLMNVVFKLIEETKYQAPVSWLPYLLAFWSAMLRNVHSLFRNYVNRYSTVLKKNQIFSVQVTVPWIQQLVERSFKHRRKNC